MGFLFSVNGLEGAATRWAWARDRLTRSNGARPSWHAISTRTWTRSRDTRTRLATPPRPGAAAQPLLDCVLRSRARHWLRPPTLEYQVKAAFPPSFATYTEWPARRRSKDPSSPDCASASSGRPVRGESPLNRMRRMAPGHPLVTEASSSGRRRGGCRPAVRATRADDRRRASDGGTMGSAHPGRSRPVERRLLGLRHHQFRIDEGRVRFHVNRTAAQRSGLRLSSKLLRIARRVR